MPGVRVCSPMPSGTSIGTVSPVEDPRAARTRIRVAFRDRGLAGPAARGDFQPVVAPVGHALRFAAGAGAPNDGTSGAWRPDLFHGTGDLVAAVATRNGTAAAILPLRTIRAAPPTACIGFSGAACRQAVGLQPHPAPCRRGVRYSLAR